MMKMFDVGMLELTPSRAETLLASILPPNSCINTLNNLKMAMKQKLFLHEDFYNEITAKKFFGDYYRINLMQENPKMKELWLSSRYVEDQLENHDFPWIPCFIEIRISRSTNSVVKSSGKRQERVESNFRARGARTSFKATHVIAVEQFLTIFGEPDAIRSYDVSDFLPPPMHGQTRTQEQIDNYFGKKYLTPHRFGAKELIYRIDSEDYKAVALLDTYPNGLVGTFNLFSGEK